MRGLHVRLSEVVSLVRLSVIQSKELQVRLVYRLLRMNFVAVAIICVGTRHGLQLTMNRDCFTKRPFPSILKGIANGAPRD